ncbi:MAG: hypothetical protein EOP49_00415 [Sphingobacteriales bacterium]|nr:MAG: hypothetical protein EOP49_00415 [Sphingobacteriales bacterium]
MQLLFWILAILFSAGIGYWVYLADKKRQVPYPWLTALLRAMVVFVTAVLLIAPSISKEENETRKPVILFLQDNSSSIPFALGTDTAKYRREADAFLAKLAGVYQVVRWGFGNRIQKDTLFSYSQQATDISSAIAQASDFYGQQNLGAVILASDGRFNQGINPQFQDLALNAPVYTVAMGDSLRRKDIRISNVYANRTVTMNSQFEIRADILAQSLDGHRSQVEIREVGGQLIGAPSLVVAGNRFDKSYSFTLQAGKPGLHHYIISTPAAPGELNLSNNRKDVFVEVVSEKKKILIAAAAPHPDINAIREALAGVESYQVDVRTADKLPASFSEYHVIILHSLPSMSASLQQIARAGKPVWLIMGGGSNNQAFNQWQNLARLNVNGSNLQPLSLSPDPSFNAFNLPVNLNAVMDKMPPLSVPAGTIQANPNAQVLFFSRGNQKMPLWLLDQGTTPAALLVGEGIWRWRLFEYRHFSTHHVVDEAIRQTVSFLTVNVNDRPFRVEMARHVWTDQEPVTMTAYLLNSNSEQVNEPDVRLEVTGPDAKKQVYSLERFGNAYRLNLGLRAAGTYAYTASTVYKGTRHVASGSFVVQSMPLEMLETGADYPLLYSLAKKYQGALVPHTQIASLYDSIKANPVIKPVIESREDRIPLIEWRWYFGLILLLAVSEWLLRKYWMAQ